MYTSNLKLSLALKALGVTVSDTLYFDEAVLLTELKKSVKRIFSLKAPGDIVTDVLGENDRNIEGIIEIIVNQNIEVAYKIFDELRNTYIKDETLYFNLIQALFDDHKKISFLVYCYIRDTELTATVDLYNEGAIFNTIFNNDYIINKFQSEFLNLLVLSPDENELFDDMLAAILTVKHNPGLLKENYNY